MFVNSFSLAFFVSREERYSIVGSKYLFIGLRDCSCSAKAMVIVMCINALESGSYENSNKVN